jgi:hypothetical protein
LLKSLELTKKTCAKSNRQTVFGEITVNFEDRFWYVIAGFDGLNFLGIFSINHNSLILYDNYRV